MKAKWSLILTALILSLALAGCAPGGNLPDATGDGTQTSQGQGSTSQAKAYEAMIAQLQSDLALLQAEHLSRTAEYEEKIAELEAKLAESGNTGTEAPGDAPSKEPPETSVFTYTEASGGLTITGYLGTDTQVQIPSEIDGKPVIGIGDSAFRNSAAEQIIVPDGVLTIGWFAFFGSYKLSSVILPASVESIEYGAFELCSGSLRISCPSGSYAAKYAVSYGIPVIAQSAV